MLHEKGEKNCLGKESVKKNSSKKRKLNNAIIIIVSTPFAQRILEERRVEWWYLCRGSITNTNILYSTFWLGLSRSVSFLGFTAD